MRRNRNLRACFGLAILVMTLVSYGSSQTRRRNREAPAERRKPFWDLAQRYLSDENGRVRMDLWATGMDAFAKMRRSNWTLRGVTPQTIPSTFVPDVRPYVSAQTPETTWYPLGPAPLTDIYSPVTIDSAEVVGIAIDPRGESDRVIYIATGLGGIWKTTNGGATWEPKTDEMPSLDMGAVALDAGNPDIVYAGTGNGYEPTGTDRSTWQRIKAIGIYRSADGGDSWVVQGSGIFGPTPARGGLTIFKIVSPVANGILVATDQGLYYSPNGGDTFGSNFPNFNNRQPVLTGDVRDLALDTHRPNIVYAAVAGRGILRSLNYGLTFPLNMFQFASGVRNPGAPTAGTFGPLWFTQSRYPNNRTFYASVVNVGTTNADVYKSANGGATWALVRSLATSSSTRPDYAVTIGVDPSNPRKVYAGVVGLWRSTDGGALFTETGDNFVHADHHVIAFSPPRDYQGRFVRPLVYVGTDGGIYSSTDSGETWRVNMNRTISANLIVDFAMGRNDPRYLYAGIWDHGVASRSPQDTATSWRRGDFGDGANIAIHPTDATICYHSSGMMGGSPPFIRTTDGGQSWNGVPGVNWTPDRVFFVPRRSAGRIVSLDVYAARDDELYRITSPTRGISPTLITTVSGPIHRLSYSEIQPEAVWLTTTTGDVWRTRDITASPSIWTNIGSPGGARIAAIAAHPRNDDQACVVYAGFSDSRPELAIGRIYARHVYCTTNGGVQWRDISSGSGVTEFPDLPAYDIVIVEDQESPLLPAKVIVATEAGVLINEGTLSSPSWSRLGWGLPTSACNRLQYVPSARALAVSVWGRGIFRFGSRG